MSTILVTRTQFEFSIVAEFADYAGQISDRLMLTEVPEQELRKFKLANSCQKGIRAYFSRYDGDNPPTDDDNGLNKADIESIVELFNTVTESNYWYEFPED
jgi:hypothetical protein